jgi:hypothetical protein
MATNFPGGLDALTNPTSSDNLDSAAVLHDVQHANANDAIEAIQAKVGIDSSAVTTSLDYKLAHLPVEFGFACSDETSALTVGTSKLVFRMPHAMTLTGVRASVTTAPVGSTLVVDINEAGTSVLSTKLSIDASEKTSTTAASAAVISDTALADDAEITIDIDQVGSSTAGAGLKVYIIGRR